MRSSRYLNLYNHLQWIVYLSPTTINNFFCLYWRCPSNLPIDTWFFCQGLVWVISLLFKNSIKHSVSSEKKKTFSIKHSVSKILSRVPLNFLYREPYTMSLLRCSIFFLSVLKKRRSKVSLELILVVSGYWIHIVLPGFLLIFLYFSCLIISSIFHISHIQLILKRFI